MLFHRPETAREYLRPGVREDGVRRAGRRLDAWQQGRTGYPIVDAGMRQLRATGWMHNRVRMIVATFLVKDLHLEWQLGARHFMRQLGDGDLASNPHNWQWVAGCGTDAAPYFRVFNPTPGPEVRPGRRLRAALGAGAAPTSRAAVRTPGDPPSGYPRAIVDHAAERAEALEPMGADPPLTLVSCDRRPRAVPAPAGPGT